MAYENTDDLRKDCGPTFTAFLEGMADHNKEQMELNAKFASLICKRKAPKTHTSRRRFLQFSPRTARRHNRITLPDS